MSEYTCRDCGGEMIGDGYTAALHCENVDMPTGVEADAPPIYCGFKEVDNEDG